MSACLVDWLETERGKRSVVAVDGKTICGSANEKHKAYRFNGIYNNSERTLDKFSQYRFLLTPDFSTYADMDMWRQMESVAKNRWVGAFWQEHGLTVNPTISWSTASSFDFCFDGVVNDGTVAVGMIGCKSNRLGFMQGYDAMLERLDPEMIICFGKPFPKMRGNIVAVDDRSSRKAVR